MKKKHNIRTVYLKRKRQGKTNYRKRRQLLHSSKARLVYRVSSRHITVQVVEFHPQGDKVLVTASSQQLQKKGWPYSGKNIPAAYLVGYSAGKKAQAKGVTEAIVDIGLCQHKAGSRMYAAVKGACDAGLKIPTSPKVFPSEDRLQGKHISNYASKLKQEQPEKFTTLFSAQQKNDLTAIGKVVEEIKAKG